VVFSKYGISLDGKEREGFVKIKQLVNDDFEIYLAGPPDNAPVFKRIWYAQTSFQVNLGNKNGPEYLIGKGRDLESAIYDLLTEIRLLTNSDIKKTKGRCEI
jgi:hypothetical protein